VNLDLNATSKGLAAHGMQRFYYQRAKERIWKFLIIYDNHRNRKERTTREFVIHFARKRKPDSTKPLNKIK
jgi:hypothetical protein